MTKSKYTLPLVPLRGITLFPGMVLHFDVGRPKSVAAVKHALEHDKLVYLCHQSEILIEDPDYDDLAKIGTISEIKQILNLPDGNIRILVEGIHRGKITEYRPTERFVEVEIEKQPDIPAEDPLYVQVLIRRLQRLTQEFLDFYDRFSPEAIASLLSFDDPGEMADSVAANLPIQPKYKQTVLDEINVTARLELLLKIMSDELEILSAEKAIMEKVQKNVDKNQREYILREKLKVIHEELGDDESAESDVRKYRKQLENRSLPNYVKDKLEEEFKRLLNTNFHSQEYGVIQNYIETILSLPWDIKDEENCDIQLAAKILNRDHYGLDKVKESILEYLAVKQLSQKTPANILCLAGPPGTGKTSIAKSLAEALGRKYVRISLGGVQNEAEIRGHRKTYIGAMPGRIIEAIKKCGTKNPLILFDEIDKMSKDYSGDPASAMLEVLDPEQNKNFRDHFIELPFDLSEVLFVTTANNLETLSRPLLDRMDVIEISGYTPDEKLEIGKKYLLPKQREICGLNASNLNITPTALRLIIDSYTRESGVRNLERKISTLCRKAARELVETNKEKISISQKNLSNYLGKPIYHYDKNDHIHKIGIATGLAWTESGGDTLFIEVNVMPGSGKLELTGNLGDVMQESAKAAYSYIRAHTAALSIPADFYKKKDIHIHIPEGAVPKDGPSAGITMATALISALTERPVCSDVAMTGEITLRGRVLPIGGLKEKSLAAFRMGIKKMIIPFENKPDYEELPAVVKENIEFTFAQNLEDVLQIALTNKTVASPSKNDRFIMVEQPLNNHIEQVMSPQ